MVIMMISEIQCLVTMSRHLGRPFLRLECSVFKFSAFLPKDIDTEKRSSHGVIFIFWKTEKTAMLSEKARESPRAAFGIVLKVKAVVMRVNGVYFWNMRMHEQ